MTDDEPRLTDFKLKDLDTGVDLGPYQDAYNAAPEATKAAILDALQDVDDDTPLLYAVLGSGTPPFKMPKEAADYRDEPDGGERCANCEFFYVGADGDAICAKVRGGVRGAHWCRLWQSIAEET